MTNKLTDVFAYRLILKSRYLNNKIDNGEVIEELRYTLGYSEDEAKEIIELWNVEK